MNEPKDAREPIVPGSEEGADIAPLPVEDVERVGVEPRTREIADERSPRGVPPPLDHSDRASGNDQDIDTAGEIPATRAGGDID